MRISKISARLLSVVLAVMMLFSLVTVGFTASAAKVEVAETGATIPAGTYLYLKPNSNWIKDGAWFAMYLWEPNDATWVKMEKVADSSTTVYRGLVPEGSRGKVIFCRMNPSKTALDWGSKWDQSVNLTYDGKNNCWAPASGQWNDATGSWSTYADLTLLTAPEAPAAPTVTVSGALGGDGSEAAPYLVAPEADTTLIITGALGSANGLSYAVDNTTKTDLAVGGNSTVATVTAPALDESKAVAVNLWAYNKAGTSVMYSDTYATTTVYIKGYEQADTPDTPVVDNTFSLSYQEADGLYAYAKTLAEGETLGANAWQRWYENSDGRNFYLPASASDTEVIILNTYSDQVLLNGVIIPAGEYAVVPYEAGTSYVCSGATNQIVTISKTDAEGTLFINNAEGATAIYEDDKEDSATGTYDLYAFLTGGTKNREAKKLGGAVASSDGVSEDTTVKKIKGRGNSTWGLAKKPFNITYSSAVTVDGMTGAKWSLLANAQDPSLLRNRLAYDLANEIGMKYACDSRFVDWFVNGRYKGSYQLTQKIEMGENTVMPDLNEVETDNTKAEYLASDFDFILEMDSIDNATNAGDKYATTKLGQVMTYKTPDAPTEEQAAWILEKYQAVENAIYGGDYATLCTLVDIDDFARAYLVNEVTKNMDAGITSTYFTYSAAAGKFYVSPVWDYDNALGNSVNSDARFDKNGKVLDLTSPANWYTRDLRHYGNKYQSVFAQACEMTEFWAKVKEIWAADFAGVADILEGAATAEKGRLQTADAYLQSLAKSGEWNYTMWDMVYNNGWVAAHDSLTMYDYNAEANTVSSSVVKYENNTLNGQAQYAADWMISRLNWLSAQFSEAETVAPDGYITVYFTNNWAFETQNAYWWETDKPDWPGVAMTFVETNSNGENIYSANIPADATGLIFSGISDEDHKTLRQTVDITEGIVDGAGFYCLEEITEGNNKKITVGTYTYKPTVETTTTTSTEVATTTVAATTAAATTDETTPVVTTTQAPVVEEYITIYFSNAWVWKDVRVHTFGSAFEADTEWPGKAMTLLYTNDYGQEVYSATVAADVTGIVFTGKDGETLKQSADIVPEDGYGYYMDWSEEEGEHTDKYLYEEPVVETTAAATTAAATTAAATTEDPTTPDEVITPDEVVVDYYIHANFNLDGVEWNDVLLEGEGTVVTATVELPAGEYMFKITDMTNWYGNDGTFTDTCEGWTMKTEAGDCTFIATGGTYTFTFDTETKKVSVDGDYYGVHYTATWDEADIFTVVTDMDATAIKEGTDFTFTVEVPEGYIVAGVIANMETIYADENGVYTITMTEDVEILVVTAEEVVVPEIKKTFTVIFVDENNNIIAVAKVEEGTNLPAPQAPEKAGYEFVGWSQATDNVVKDMIVVAQYKKIVKPVEPATIGKLRLEVAGGTGFTIAFGDGAARPQGTSYMNTKAPIGATVTVVANTVDGVEFIGWVNEAGAIASKSYTYTFTTSGNDYLKAMYKTEVAGVYSVTFMNDKAFGGNGQILDMQYYAAGDEIVFPDAPSQAGFDFTGWNMDAAAIQAKLAAGENVTVLAKWEVAKVYVAITVNGGKVTYTIGTDAEGKYRAYNRTVVTADAAPAGQKFAYWTDGNGVLMSYDEAYEFYPAADTVLNAVYVDEAETVTRQPVVTMAADPTTTGEKITYYLSWDIPETVGTVTNVGFMIVNKSDYNEETFYLGTTDSKVFTGTLPAANNVPKKTFTAGKGGSLYDNTYVACTWVKYKDAATGEIVTIYSELIEVYKPAP